MYEIPKTMQAAVINKYGNNDEIQMSEVPVPICNDNDVLIQVKAASVNPLDIRIREGKLKQVLPYKFPLILGNDLSGVIVKIGTAVDDLKVGNEVYARTDTMRIGTFAEYIAIDERNVALKPDNLTMEESAAVPLVALTAWQALVKRTEIRRDSKVLVHGGAGGVGSIAIQLAKHLSAHVATTARASDFERLRSYGADVLIDYKTEDFSTIIKGYDVVLDTRGGDTLHKSLEVLRKGGHVISINGPPDVHMAKELGLGKLLEIVFMAMSYSTNRSAKKLGVDYSFLFMQPSGEQLDELRKLFEDGTLKPVVDKVYPFALIIDAVAYLESGKAKGKIVVTM